MNRPLIFKNNVYLELFKVTDEDQAIDCAYQARSGYSRTRSVFLCVLLHSSIDAGANYWLAPLPDGDLLYLELMDAVLWLAAIPVFVVLAKSPRRQVLVEAV